MSQLPGWCWQERSSPDAATERRASELEPILSRFKAPVLPYVLGSLAAGDREMQCVSANDYNARRNFTQYCSFRNRTNTRDSAPRAMTSWAISLTLSTSFYFTRYVAYVFRHNRDGDPWHALSYMLREADGSCFFNRQRALPVAFITFSNFTMCSPAGEGQKLCKAEYDDLLAT